MERGQWIEGYNITLGVSTTTTEKWMQRAIVYYLSAICGCVSNVKIQVGLAEMECRARRQLDGSCSPGNQTRNLPEGHNS